MFSLYSYIEIVLIAPFVEGFFFGLYSGIFVLYLQCHASKKDTNKIQNLIFYFLCVLYVLSVALFVCDTATTVLDFLGLEMIWTVVDLSFVQVISFGFCDFIAQSILIYRCWIVWGRNIRVVIIPSILAFAFLVIWLVSIIISYIHLISGLEIAIFAINSLNSMTTTALALTLAVNPLVTGLIVFRIFKVFREVKTTLEDQILGAAGGTKLRRIIFILIESGMALFCVQSIRLGISILYSSTRMLEGGDSGPALLIIMGVHNMLIGITPTIILVRTSMGLSFDDEKSIEEAAIESLRFASNHPNPVPEMGSIGIVGQDSRNDDGISIQGSNDIEVVER